MAEQKILLIDDDETLVNLVSDHLRETGYECVAADNGSRGLQLAGREEPDIVILDVMMPKMDGWEVCRQLRTKSSVPIIMLTAKDQELDKLRGFRLGVDDYVTKPFSLAELAARVGAVLSRHRGDPGKGKALTSDNLSIDFEHRRVTVDGENVNLTPTEYKLLETLARHSGRPVPIEMLLKEIWGPAYAGEYEHVRHFIWSLRKKIEEDMGDPKHILTERSFGYRFE